MFLFLTTCVATSFAKQKECKVKSALEFLKALGSDRIITVEGVINLSDALQYDDKCSAAGVSTLQPCQCHSVSLLIRLITLRH